jgi:hypothetical protein
MASRPKQTIYTGIAESGGDANFTDIPVTMVTRWMEITECAPASGANQGAFVPQGLQYQLWDASKQAWGPTVQNLAGATISIGDKVAFQKGHGGPIGWPAQTMVTKTRAADIPIRIMSGTSTATQVLVNEWN